MTTHPVSPVLSSDPDLAEMTAIDILLVDDRPENLLALEAILEPLGERLVRANSGDEALRHLLTRDFACILLDVQMPGMSGFETAELIRQRARTQKTPIMFAYCLRSTWIGGTSTG